MAAISDYLESGLLHHIFRGHSFTKPNKIAVALTSGVPQDSHTGATLLEIPSGINGSGTGYARLDLGAPSASGNSVWLYLLADHNVGSGVIKNSASFVFNTALLDWGWVSGVALVDDERYGSGNVLMHAQLDNPRIIYMGDSVKFDTQMLQVSFR